LKQILDAPKTLTCPACQGDGWRRGIDYSALDIVGSESDFKRTECPNCKGTGVIDFPELKAGPGHEEATR
jgi:DnaJ-class molecular chaperone